VQACRRRLTHRSNASGLTNQRRGFSSGALRTRLVVLPTTSSRYTTPHHITSNTTSHRIASHRTTSHRIASHRIASHRITHCHVHTHEPVFIAISLNSWPHARTSLAWHMAVHGLPQDSALRENTPGGHTDDNRVHRTSDQITSHHTLMTMTMTVCHSLLLLATHDGLSWPRRARFAL
jgi:hypothetical protein